MLASTKKRTRELGANLAREVSANLLADLVRLAIWGLGALILVFAVQGGHVPAWTLIVVIGLFGGLAALGWWLGREGGLAAALRREVEYSVHLQNGLEQLQLILSGAVQAQIPFFIEQAVLAPALQILAAKPIADPRLSVLRPDPEDETRWTMSWAAGHSMGGRLRYDKPIAETLSRHAFERGEVQYWPDTESQTEFEQNPLASAPTRAMISIPIRRGEQTLGVFNAVSSQSEAFEEADRTFLLSLAGVIAVAVGVWLGEVNPPDGGATVGEQEI